MKNRHWGITVLAVLGYISAALTLLGGIALIFGAGAIATFLANYVPGLSLFLTGGVVLFVILGIIFIALAVLDYFIAKGLWNGKNWARILMLVLCVLSLLGSLWPFNLVGIVIDAIVIWYLGFYKPAVAYFK